MWDAFPELGSMLRPLLDQKLKPGIVVVAALVCVWMAYKHFAEEGERAGWFNLLLKVAGVALVAVVAYNAEAIINGAVGALILVPRFVPIAQQRVLPKRRSDCRTGGGIAGSGPPSASARASAEYSSGRSNGELFQPRRTRSARRVVRRTPAFPSSWSSWLGILAIRI